MVCFENTGSSFTDIHLESQSILFTQAGFNLAERTGLESMLDAGVQFTISAAIKNQNASEHVQSGSHDKFK